MYDGVLDKPELSEEYLSHHGILGMKWGKRNGPPYPLDSSKSTGKRLKITVSTKQSKADRARSEAESAKKIADKYTSAMDKKADKRQQQADDAKLFKSTKQSKADRARSEAESAKKIADKYTSAMDKKADKRQQQADTNKLSIKERYDNLSDDQKKVLKTAAIATTVLAAGTLAAYGGVKLKVLSDATKYGKGVQTSVKRLLAEQLDKAYDMGDLAYAMPKSLDKALTKQAGNIGKSFKESYKFETKRAVREGLRSGSGIKSALKARNYDTQTFSAEYLAALASRYDNMSGKDIRDNWDNIFSDNGILNYIREYGSSAYRSLK